MAWGGGSTPTIVDCDGVTRVSWHQQPLQNRGFVWGKGWVYTLGSPECPTSVQTEPPKEIKYVDGTRLGDLSVSSSAYGAPRQIGFGTVRMPGNLIWAPGLEETKNIVYSGAVGKTTGEMTITSTYLYSSSMAVAFGEGPCQDVLRIWANGGLIFDKRDPDDEVRKGGLRFRLYKGTTTQLPDPLIWEREGLAHTPGFRGTVYIVFEGFQLEDYGNQMPTIEAEISYDTTPTRPQTLSGTAFSTVLNTYDHSIIGVDWDRGFAYYASVTASSANGISRVNLNTGIKDREALSTDSFDQTVQGWTRLTGLGGWGVMTDGSIVASVYSATPLSSNGGPVVRLDPTSLKETARFGYGSTATSMDAERWVFCDLITSLSFLGGTDKVEYALCASTLFNSIGVLSLPDLGHVWNSDINLVGGLTDSRVLAMTPGADGVSWILAGPDYTAPSTSDVHLYRMEVNGDGAVTFSLYSTWAVSDIIGGETSLDVVGPMVYDPDNDKLLVFAKGTTSGDRVLVLYDVPSDVFVWATQDIGITPTIHHWQNSRMENGTFGFIVGDNGGMIDITQAEMIHEGTLPNWTHAEQGSGAGAYDSRTESFVGFIDSVDGGPMNRFYFNRGAGNGEGLDEIVTDLCSRVGLTSGDLDVTDVASIEVPGYAIRSATSVRQAIEVLTDVYLVDSFESDWALTFAQRGSSSVRTLTESELGFENKELGILVEEDRKEEIEMPMHFTLQYDDKTNDYAKSGHSAKRISEPKAAMGSKNQVVKKYELALHPDTAKQQAEKILYSTWVGRTEYNFTTTWKHLDLDPSDVINITLDSGVSYDTRLIDSGIGADFTMEMKGESEAETSYTSGATADAGDGVIPQTVSSGGFAKSLLLDMPLISDLDEPSGRANGVLYAYQGGFSDSSFRKGLIYQSEDNIDFTLVNTEVEGMSWGVVTDTLGSPKDNNPFITDDVSSITVAMSSGSSNVVSISEADMLLGGNMAAIVKNDGEMEIISFMTVVDNGSGSFTISDMLRGLRGTDRMAWDHEAGETFVLLGTSANVGGKIADDLSHLDTLVYYRGVGSDQFFEQGDLLNLTTNHRALMPYAPLNATAVEDGSSNIDFTWERRTRVGGKLLDVTGTVPLSEDAEEYEIDIYSGPGTGAVVLRTITGITTNLYEYANADILTDFGSFPAQISFEIFQISAQAGRGFTKRFTLGLPDIEVDEYWDSVVLLSAFDGVDAATAAADDSDSEHTFVFANGAQLDTAQKKFGLSSVLLDGVDDNLYVADHDDFDFDTDPFTVEGWFRWNTIQGSYNGLVGQWQASVAEKWLLRWDTAGTLEFRIDALANPVITVASGSWTPSLSTWYHIAVDRDASNNFRIYVDGAVIGSGTSTYDISLGGSPQMSIGHYQGTNELDGWVDEVRITKGVARYAGAFTAPTVPFPRPVQP